LWASKNVIIVKQSVHISHFAETQQDNPRCFNHARIFYSEKDTDSMVKVSGTAPLYTGSERKHSLLEIRMLPAFS
jgi:hypothetical protein